MNGLLSGKNIVVIGSGTIGAAIAHSAVDSGARVMTWDLNPDAPRRPETAATPPGARTDGSGEMLDHLAVDILDPDAVDRAVATTIWSMGTIDSAVISVGVVKIQTIDDTTDEDWRRVMATNVEAPFMVCRALSEHLAASANGSLVLIGSISGLRGEPELGHYSASKFALVGLTQSLASEWGPRGVRINCLCPGAVDSGMNDLVMERDSRRSGTPVDQIRANLATRTPLGRLCTPEDVAWSCLFFLSDLSRFVTGETLAVSGGLR